jgi:hypothetical protein
VHPIPDPLLATKPSLDLGDVLAGAHIRTPERQHAEVGRGHAASIAPPREAEAGRLVAVDTQEGEGGDRERTEGARELLCDDLHVLVCGAQGEADQ